MLPDWVGQCYRTGWGSVTGLGGAVLPAASVGVTGCDRPGWGSVTGLGGTVLPAWVGQCYRPG